MSRLQMLEVGVAEVAGVAEVVGVVEVVGVAAVVVDVFFVAEALGSEFTETTATTTTVIGAPAVVDGSARTTDSACGFGFGRYYACRAPKERGSVFQDISRAHPGDSASPRF